MKKITFVALYLLSNTVFAAVFNIPNGDIVALINAINIANNNAQPDVINLAVNGTYDFNIVNNIVSGQPFGYTETEGPVALPIIANETVSGIDLVFNLNGSTLRLIGTAKTRLFYSANGTSWTLNNGTIKDFESPINNPIVNRGGGGGAIVVGETNNFASSNMTFENCKSNSLEERSGGAIYIKGNSTVLIENSTYKNNVGVNYGGAITVLLSDVVVKNCIFENNTCTIGGGAAIYVDGCMGPIGNSGGIGQIVECTFTNNNAPFFGAVYLQGYFQDNWFVKKCQFTNNRAIANGGMAGAIWHNGANNVGISLFDVSESSFQNNEAKTHGGAITCGSGSNNFTNCTFFANKTFLAGGLGGAIYNLEDPGISHFATIKNCTFANNIAGGYGGAWCITNSQGAVKNTIVSNNLAYQQCGFPPALGCVGYNNANNCAGNLANSGNNIEFPERPNRVANPSFNDPNDAPCFAREVVLNSDVLPVKNPLLINPAANGGLTTTMALQPLSPAINAGADCTLTDQRGAARVGICDIGAFEFGAVLEVSTFLNSKCEFQIVPNPNSGSFSLKIPNQFKNKIIDAAIFSLDGKMILQQHNISSRLNNFEILQKGIYMLKTTIENQIFTNKIIIQ